MKIYNGEGMILGRLAARVAKDALLGEEVKVVNCEKIVLSGRKRVTLNREKVKVDRGPHPMLSPRTSRLPYLLVRRSIRGMLPWKHPRGKEAYKRVLCYTGLPAEFAGKELIALPDSSWKKLPTLKFLTVGQICKELGGK